jgi:phosphoribosylformylglycinamidine (FGAM) synthase PurS component
MQTSVHKTPNGQLRVGVQILPRDVILDSQGRTVAGHFQASGIKVQQCRIGKYIEIEFDPSFSGDPVQEVEKMLRQGLYNPLIEKYEIV